MVTLDTSAIVALMDRRDPNYQLAVRAAGREVGRLVIPTPIMAEVTYFIERRFSPMALDLFLADIEADAYQLDCCEADLGRVRELAGKYADMPLGYADASVIACAERRGGRVLSFDRRHFGVVAREGRIQLVS